MRLKVRCFFLSIPLLLLAGNAKTYQFPKHFLKGVALSAYQNGGDIYGKSNWSYFEQQKNILGNPTIARNQRCANATDFWNRAFDDIKLIKELGCNALRFSVEWA